MTKPTTRPIASHPSSDIDRIAAFTLMYKQRKFLSKQNVFIISIAFSETRSIEIIEVKRIPSGW